MFNLTEHLDTVHFKVIWTADGQPITAIHLILYIITDTVSVSYFSC